MTRHPTLQLVGGTTKVTHYASGYWVWNMGGNRYTIGCPEHRP